MNFTSYARDDRSSKMTSISRNPFKRMLPVQYFSEFRYHCTRSWRRLFPKYLEKHSSQWYKNVKKKCLGFRHFCKLNNTRKDASELL